MSCGGLSEIQDATLEVQNICNEIRNKLESFQEFTAIKYKSQVVAGTNYFVKIRVGPDEYIHVRIYKPLPHTGAPAELSAHQKNKTLTDEIVYIERD